VPFDPLTQDTVMRVVDKFIMQLEALLSERDVSITLSDSARVYLAKTGYDPTMGARPLARLIQDRIKRPLAEELLFGSLQNGGAVFIDLKGDELVFSYDEDNAEPTTKKTKPNEAVTV
jgi:ATP-dependent Clp protease ATP-binding subunit ClpA